MKTMPLEEAMKLPIPGPRTARFPSGITASGEVFRYFPHIEVPSIFTNPDRLVVNQGGYEMAVHDAHAALLAHFYNHGPELVQTVADLESALSALLAILGQKPEINKTVAEARSLLAKASTVQMP